MVDNSSNTAENNEQEKPEQESPQSILERRLAELNANKAPAEPAAAEANKPGNTTGDFMSGALAEHEKMPAAAVPTTGTEPENTPEIETVDEKSETEESDLIAVEAAPASEYFITEPAIAAMSAEDLTGNAIQQEEESGTDQQAEMSLNDETTVSNTTSGFEAATDNSLSELPTAGEEMSTAGTIPAQTASSDMAVAASPEAATETAPVASAGVAHSDEVSDDDQENGEDISHEDDYSNLSVEELRGRLLSILKTASRKNSRQVFDMHREYETKMAVERAEALQRFIAEGGAADDFEFHAGPAHKQVEQAIQQFRENRSKEQRQDEEQKTKNARRKQELLEQLRELVETPETRSSADKIKNIQNEWKALGPVPAGEAQQLWSSYHALLDIFYNNRSIFFELKELDRRKNLQYKLQLCERAEALEQTPSINNALQELRHLHEEWKHVGPVPNEQRDSIWDRFIQASEKVHVRKKEYISERRSKEQENLTKKQELLSRIEPFLTYQTDRINDWRDKTDEIQKLKEEWDATGLVPKEKADEINKRFWSSYKAFFNHKNAFFKVLDDQKMQNLRQKTALCEQAEALKDSTDWDETKETLIQLQKKWKTIGRVPDKYSDKLWQRFRSACNEFFDRKQNQVQQRETEINKLSAEKNAFYEKLASRMTTIEKNPGTVEELEAFRSGWSALDTDAAARGNSRLEDKFYDLLQKYSDTISTLSNQEKSNLAIDLTVTRIKQSPDAANRIYQKEQSIRKEISLLENNIRTLKTNIEFFARSKNAEKLREEYQSRIDEADSRIEQLQRQLQAIRQA